MVIPVLVDCPKSRDTYNSNYGEGLGHIEQYISHTWGKGRTSFAEASQSLQSRVLVGRRRGFQKHPDQFRLDHLLMSSACNGHL